LNYKTTLSLFVLLASAGCVSSSDPYANQVFSETQTCTTGTCAGTAPTGADAGAALNSVDKFRLMICAASGQTLSGAGTMQAYYCDAVSNLCYRDTGLDQTVTASGVRCATFPDFNVGYVTAQQDTVEFVASGVTVSGGAALTERIYTHNERYK
jgi:hypothetical protein